MQYRFGAYCFDPARYELCHARQSVPLRPQACELLAYLLRHRDRVVSKDELLAQVWPEQYVDDGVLHACMLAVRMALHDTGRTPSLLHTVRGRAIALCRQWRCTTCSSTPPRRPRTPCRPRPHRLWTPSSRRPPCPRRPWTLRLLGEIAAHHDPPKLSRPKPTTAKRSPSPRNWGYARSK